MRKHCDTYRSRLIARYEFRASSISDGKFKFKSFNKKIFDNNQEEIKLSGKCGNGSGDDVQRRRSGWRNSNK